MSAEGMGRPLRRREDYRLLTGAGSYGSDVVLPGQAHAIMVRSVYAHARLLGIDTALARAAPGVLAVLTHADYAADEFKPFPLGPGAMSPPDIKLRNEDGSEVFLPPFFPLAADRVRYVGEGVAWVVAESVNAAKSAAELVDVSYEPLPATADGRAASACTAEPLWGTSNVALDAQAGKRAATDAAFDRAAHVVRLDTFVPRVTGVPMETRTAAANYDAALDVITLYAGGGSVVKPKDDLIKMLGLPAEKVRVVVGDVGGNFGTRNYTYPEFILVAWSARRLRRPVKWICERSESFLTDFHGRDLAVSAELALDAEGNFMALRASNLSNIGAYPVSFIPLTKGTELMSSVYHIPLAAARARAVFSNTPATVPYRSAGRPEAMFVIERLIDKAAQAFGFDRIALRRRNFIRPDALPYANPFGMNYDSGAYEHAFDQAMKLADVEGFPARRQESLGRGLERGVGFGCYIESASGYPHERATVTVATDNRVTVVIGTLSAGQGHETSFAQVVTELLGVPSDQVAILTGDTDVVTAGGGSHSGRSMRHAATTISMAGVSKTWGSLLALGGLIGLADA